VYNSLEGQLEACYSAVEWVTEHIALYSAEETSSVCTVLWAAPVAVSLAEEA